MSNSSDPIDLDYRPRSYHWANRLRVNLSSSIKGAARKRLYERSIAEGERLPNALFQHSLDEEQRTEWGRGHPTLMGGEYLPDRADREVEVARIVIASTTQDVTCVYARECDGAIRLRVVDEYGGDTLTGDAERCVQEPLTLREFVDFFLEAWDLIACLDMNFGERHHPREDVHSFVLEASSDHYPMFEATVRDRIDEWILTKPDLEHDQGEKF